ncbi:MAG TPA: polyprenyl synthetase family protein [Nocardia sp.]|uniref:polyprenyl synthetase family protein n=1 Tax=Nocardia sp. TaxID=1821 RepID=UPI002B4B6ED6|nr:polyprenyl synthetase family protein [Nocardia sp.]HLS77868.1 polyprenyl synthetase family protein [Nocardia sp.]
MRFASKCVRVKIDNPPQPSPRSAARPEPVPEPERPVRPTEPRIGDPAWFERVRASLRGHTAQFVASRCAEELAPLGFAEPIRALGGVIGGGKALRPTFMYLGWLCGADESEAALRASASLELLHAFALVQDDVMDESDSRRGRPAAHVRMARWHARGGHTGSSARFGESAAVLLGDLCLVWAERMLRESGIDAAAAARVWPHYDAMRAELAIGQLADLLNDAAHFPSLERVLDIARRKSGNYTVRRPLELGAAMAGCPAPVLEALGDFGGLIGEAFQIRDDLLGLFGDPAITGKPAGADLRDRKATTVVVLAGQLATPAARARLHQFLARPELDDHAVADALTLIDKSGAPRRAEQMIAERLLRAESVLDRSGVDPVAAEALVRLARRSTDRSH